MRKVLLYSGGMDSYIIAHIEPDAQLLYIDSGSPYSREERRLLHLAPRAAFINEGMLDLADVERDDAIVPARNLLLVTVASYYGDHILLGSTAGDNSTDKDYDFCEMSSELLSHIYDCDHFPDRYGVKVEAPYKEWTKKDLVEWYVQRGYDVDKLTAGLSCYNPIKEGHCGACKACIRKWTALQAAGVDWWPEGFNPVDYNWLPIINKMEQGWWRCPGEDAYTLRVLQKHGVV